MIDRTFVVYRFYNADDELLYVGWSHNVLKRFEKHRYERKWWKQIARIELDHRASAAAARTHEAVLIATLRPIHNRQHNPDWTTNGGRWGLKKDWIAAHRFDDPWQPPAEMGMYTDEAAS